MRVDGNTFFNKNLLGYVIDGKCRMIAVKDKNGCVVARSLIKLLWDDVKKTPVLFFETPYFNIAGFAITVKEMAAREATRLGVELVTPETANGRRFRSWPNRSGFEYESAGEVIQRLMEEGSGPGQIVPTLNMSGAADVIQPQ